MRGQRWNVVSAVKRADAEREGQATYKDCQVLGTH